MDKTTLVERQIQEGKLLLSELDKKNLEIKAAFWIYDEADSFWKFTLASSSKQLDVKENPLNAYKSLTEVIRSTPNLYALSTSDVVLIPLDHPLIRNIAPLIKTGPGIVDMTFSNSLLNQIYIQGMHLYRMDLQ